MVRGVLGHHCDRSGDLVGFWVFQVGFYTSLDLLYLADASHTLRLFLDANDANNASWRRLLRDALLPCCAASPGQWSVAATKRGALHLFRSLRDDAKVHMGASLLLIVCSYGTALGLDIEFMCFSLNVYGTGMQSIEGDRSNTLKLLFTLVLPSTLMLGLMWKREYFSFAIGESIALSWTENTAITYFDEARNIPFLTHASSGGDDFHDLEATTTVATAGGIGTGGLALGSTLLTTRRTTTTRTTRRMRKTRTRTRTRMMTATLQTT